MKKLLLLMICFMFMRVADSFAEPQKKHSWGLGVVTSYIEYEEPGVMKEDGIMCGILGSYTYRDKCMLKLEGRYAYGEVDYDGQLDDGTDYTVSNIDDTLFEIRGLVGYDFLLSEIATLTPYIGMGYRYLNDALDEDIYGYQRESNYFYSPIGVEANTRLLNGWSVGLKFEYDYFWKGIQKSHFSDIDIGLSDVENDQNSGYGCRGSMVFLKEGKDVDFLIEHYMIYWSIKKSEDASITYVGNYIGYAWEPKNNSKEYGIKCVARF